MAVHTCRFLSDQQTLHTYTCALLCGCSLNATPCTQKPGGAQAAANEDVDFGVKKKGCDALTTGERLRESGLNSCQE